MNRYLRQTLYVNEEILLTPKLHWIAYFDNYFNMAVLYLLFCESMDLFIENSRRFSQFFITSEKYIAAALLLRIFYLFVKNFFIEMAVTNYRVIFKEGIIHIASEELSNDKVETVSVNQSILGRILNYGNIIFSGTGTGRLIYKKVFAPWWVKARIENVLRQVQNVAPFNPLQNINPSYNNMPPFNNNGNYNNYGGGYYDNNNQNGNMYH